VASLDKTVTVYNLSQNKNCRSIKMNFDFEVLDMDFSCKNIVIASGKAKKASIKEALLVNGFQEDVIVTQNKSVRSVNWSSSGNRFISASHNIIKLFRVTHRNFISSFTGHTNSIRCARFSPSNNMIASCSEDKTVKIFDVKSHQLIHSFKDEKGFGNQLAWHKDDNIVAIAQENGRVKIFDIAQRKLIQYYRIYDSPVKSVDFHPSGAYLVTGDEKGQIVILDLYEGRDVFTINGHHEAVTAVKFSKDGQHFCSGSKDRHIMVFQSNLKDNSAANTSLDMSADNKENSVHEEATLVDARKSINYNYLNNDEINV
jgi:centriolar protein POC1